ncbi:MAG: glycosyltransferase family 4 protein [Bacteroidia bacterium]
MKILAISDYRSFHTVRPEAEIFIGLAKMGEDISVMTYGDCEYAKRFKDAGIRVIDFHPEKKLDAKEINFIKAYLVENNIDIIHLFNSKAIINGIQAAKDLKTKIVLYRGYTGNIHWYDPAMYLKFLHPAVDAIQCNSVGVADLFKRQLFFKKNKAFAINKGHKSDWYRDVEATDLKKEFNLPNNSLVLINVANNRKMKGIPYLLEAITKIDKSIPVHLILVGRDMDTPENIAILKQANMENQVHFTGFRSDALSLVAGAEAFVLSSITGESITKAVIEAMSLEIPPIITDIPGNVELLEDGKSGIIVKYKNADALKEGILKFYALDESKRKAMGQEARKRIDNVLNTENTVIHVLKMYKQLLYS